MRVTYRVPRHNSGSVGFRALYSVEDSACGGEITAPSGRFTSPSYPDRYVDRLTDSRFMANESILSNPICLNTAILPTRSAFG